MSSKELTKATRPAATIANIALGFSYGAAEFITTRSIAPYYFDHVGNATVASFAAALGSYAIGRLWLRANPNADRTKVQAAMTIGGIVLGAAATGFVENPSLQPYVSLSLEIGDHALTLHTESHVYDPLDVAAGIGGSVVGGMTMSARRMDQQSSFMAVEHTGSPLK